MTHCNGTNFVDLLNVMMHARVINTIILICLIVLPCGNVEVSVYSDDSDTIDTVIDTVNKCDAYSAIQIVNVDQRGYELERSWVSR